MVSDSLSDTSTTNALSAAKGKALNDSITALNSKLAQYLYKASCANNASRVISNVGLNSVIFIARGSLNKKGVYMIDGDGDICTIIEQSGYAVSYSNSNQQLTINNTSGGNAYITVINGINAVIPT